MLFRSAAWVSTSALLALACSGDPGAADAPADASGGAGGDFQDAGDDAPTGTGGAGTGGTIESGDAGADAGGAGVGGEGGSPAPNVAPSLQLDGASGEEHTVLQDKCEPYQPALTLSDENFVAEDSSLMTVTLDLSNDAAYFDLDELLVSDCTDPDDAVLGPQHLSFRCNLAAVNGFLDSIVVRYENGKGFDDVELTITADDNGFSGPCAESQAPESLCPLTDTLVISIEYDTSGSGWGC